MGRIFKFFGASAVASVAGGLAMVQHRFGAVAERTAALDAAHEQLRREEAAVASAFAEDHKSMAADLAEEADKLAFLGTVWDDRRRRYAEQDASNRNHVLLLPEASAVNSGLSAHYQHMTEAMPQFGQFDYILGKLFSFHVLLDATRAVGLRQTEDNWRFLFRGEPVVHEIVRSFRRWSKRNGAISTGSGGGGGGGTVTVDEAAPTLPQLSAVFAHQRAALDDAALACLAAEDRQRREKAERAALRVAADAPKKVGDGDDDGAPGPVAALLLRSIGQLHVSHEQHAVAVARIRESATAAGKAEQAKAAAKKATEAARKRREELLAATAMREYTLRDEADVLSAIFHVELLRELLTDAGRFRTAAAHAPWAADPKVTRAVAALAVWRDAAERYLVERQAVRALAAFEQVLVGSVTGSTNPDGTPGPKATLATAEA